MAKKTTKKEKEIEVDDWLGKKVPKISFESMDGLASFDELRGKSVVLFFYPKDMTSGCTLESRDFEAHLKSFVKIKTVVLGVSPDSIASHKKFCDKEGLSFNLISDPDKELCGWFNVWKEKSMYGRKYMGVERSTFLIDPEGVIRHVWRKVKVPDHVVEVLKISQELYDSVTQESR